MLHTHLPRNVAVAVSLHAHANHSDPFAGSRMAMLLRSRLDDPKAVQEDAQRALKDRRYRLENDYKTWRKSSTRKEVFKHLGFSGGNRKAA